MKKLFIFLTMLVVGIVSSWATDVTVIDKSKDATAYGSFSSEVFTTNATSGMAGITVSGIKGTTAKDFAYGACLALTSTASGTITMTAPTGYIITGYELTARSNTWSFPYRLTPYVGGSAVTTSTGGVKLTASGLGAQTASFTYSAESANSFYIPSMIITVISEETVNLINVTYKLYESDGTTLVSSDVIQQEENSAIQIPSSFTAATYYDYTTTGTIGSSDCTIKVTRTLKTGYVISLDGLSNSKCYNIRNNRATWAVGSGATVVNSTNELGLAFSASDTKQQFAFVKYIDKYYLYSVSEDKFAYVDDTKLSLTADVTSAVAASPVTLGSSTNAIYQYSEPIIVKVGDNMFGVSTGKTPDVFKYNDQSDGGNCAYIIEAGEFNPATALSKIENSFLFEPSTDLAPKYYAWRTAVNNKPSYIHTDDNGDPKCPDNHSINFTGPIDAKYAWYFIGGPQNGYAIKNKSTGTYLGGRTASGGYMSMEASANCKFYPINEATATPTWNTWYDQAHNFYIDRASGAPYAHTSGNKNDYVRLYNVKFSLSDAGAGLVVGNTAISDFSAYYLITTSAVLSCAESNYRISAYDGYATLAEALENDADGIINLTIQQTVDVTYKMMFNGSVIRNEVVTEAVGVTASTPSAWTVPAYCSFTCPSTEITAETSEIEVTLNWDGPFEFSTDYANAKWYYIAVNSKWAKNYNWVSPNISSDIETVKGLDDGQWAFIGNPYDGITLMLKAKYDKTWEMYLSASVNNPALTYVIESTEKWSVKRLTATTFTLNCGDKYLVDNTSNMAFKTTDLVGNEGTFSVRSYYCQQALDNWTTYVGESTDKLFGVNPSSASSLDAVIKGMPKMTEAEYNTNFATIPNANIAGFISYNKPTTGYYRIKNNGTGNYLAYGTPTVSGGGNRPAGLIATSNSTDAASIIHLTGSNGTYKISVQGFNIQQQKNANVAFPGSTDTGVDFVFNISSPGIVSITNAASRVSDNQDGSLHEATDGWGVHGVVNWSASTANSKWVVEEATSFSGTLSNANDNTGTGHSYATLCVPFAISSISGASAYAPTEDGKYLTIGDALECPIEAGTPVILVGATDAGSYTANIETNTAPVSSPIDTYALKGTFTGTSIDCTAATGTNYVLGFDKNNDNRIGFYHVNSASYNLKPNRAYLHTSEATDDARGFVLVFDDDATGIRSIDNGELTIDNATIYNLAGQRLNKMQKGINIVNGKKVLF